jgi:ribosomal protein S18 acetylase RimI-like enzyme
MPAEGNDVEPEIRGMAPADYDRVFALWKRTEGMGLSQADSRENIERFLLRNPGLSFVAHLNGTIVGAVMSGHDGRRGFLYHLAVAPEHRLKGTGRLLVEACLKELAAQGMHKCHLFVYANNESGKKFWRRTGWTERTDITAMSRDLVK